MVCNERQVAKSIVRFKSSWQDRSCHNNYELSVLPTQHETHNSGKCLLSSLRLYQNLERGRTQLTTVVKPTASGRVRRSPLPVFVTPEHVTRRRDAVPVPTKEIPVPGMWTSSRCPPAKPYPELLMTIIPRCDKRRLLKTGSNRTTLCLLAVICSSFFR